MTVLNFSLRGRLPVIRQTETWEDPFNIVYGSVIRDGDKYTGVRLRCECPDCLIQLGIFVVENPTSILANGAGSWSVFRTDSCHAECIQRTETRLEENIRQQKSAEKAQQRQEARRRELIAMSFEQQREMMAEPFWRSEDE